MKLVVLVATTALSQLASDVSAHGAIFIPSPRNAVDRVLPTFVNGKSPNTPCTCANGVGGTSKKRRNNEFEVVLLDLGSFVDLWLF